MIVCSKNFGYSVELICLRRCAVQLFKNIVIKSCSCNTLSKHYDTIYKIQFKVCSISVMNGSVNLRGGFLLEKDKLYKKNTNRRQKIQASQIESLPTYEVRYW